MKTEYAIVKKRREDIMSYIQRNKKVTVKELADYFDTSEITIRRDLNYWEEKDAIIRNHGGAQLIQHMVNDEDQAYLNRCVHAIAKKAASFVENGDTIFINTSSTALLTVKYIGNKRCTIVTNNAKATYLEHSPEIQIVLTGGELRFPKESMVGDLALTAVSKISADKCFMGCSGLTDETLSTAILAETSINGLMIAQTKGKKFILCDHSKIGIPHQFDYCSTNEIDYLITDTDSNKNVLESLKEKDVTVIETEPLWHIND